MPIVTGRDNVNVTTDGPDQTVHNGLVNAIQNVTTAATDPLHTTVTAVLNTQYVTTTLNSD